MDRTIAAFIFLGTCWACGESSNTESEPEDLPLSPLLDTQKNDEDASETSAIDTGVIDTKKPQPPPTVPKDNITISDAVSCQNGGTPGVFTESAAKLGIVFVQDRVPTISFGPTEELPVGGGVAVADFNGDNKLDLYFANVSGSDELYLHKGGETLQYERRVQDTSQMTPRVGVYPGDVDNDGDTDLLFSPPGAYPGLMTNDGKGIFTIEGPVAPSPLPGSFEQSAAWADVNQDGILDVIIAGGPFELEDTVELTGVAERLFLGLSDLIFMEQGLPTPKNEGQAFIASPVDVDNDGDLDIYIVNDHGMYLAPNRLLINNGKGIFSDGSNASDSDIGVWGMGLAVGDIDNDGWLDLYVTTMAPLDDALLRNLGDGVFDDVTIEWGASSTAIDGGVAWGAIFIDADSDGDEDLFVTHGFHSGLAGDEFSKELQQADIFFQNNGGAFSDMTAKSGLGSTGISRSPVEADLNSDGFPDLVVGTLAGPPSVYMNACSESASWIGLRFRTNESNRSAIGTRITVEADGRTHIREIGSGSDGLYGGGPSELSIGLGAAQSIDKLHVRWPNGSTREWKDIPVKRWLTLWE